MYQMDDMIDIIPNTIAASINHFVNIRSEPFGSVGAYKGLENKKETKKKNWYKMDKNLNIDLDEGFTEDGETRWVIVSGFELGWRGLYGLD